MRSTPPTPAVVFLLPALHCSTKIDVLHQIKRQAGQISSFSDSEYDNPSRTGRTKAQTAKRATTNRPQGHDVSLLGSMEAIKNQKSEPLQPNTTKRCVAA